MQYALKNIWLHDQRNRSKKISEIVFASKIVVEHLFHSHHHFNNNWCRPKNKWKRREQIKKKNRSLAHHFIEIKRMTISYTTKFKKHISLIQPKLGLKSRFTFMILTKMRLCIILSPNTPPKRKHTE